MRKAVAIVIQHSNKSEHLHWLHWCNLQFQNYLKMSGGMGELLKPRISLAVSISCRSRCRWLKGSPFASYYSPSMIHKYPPADRHITLTKRRSLHKYLNVGEKNILSSSGWAITSKACLPGSPPLAFNARPSCINPLNKSSTQPNIVKC